MANMARGRGALQDEQGRLLPAVLSGDGQREWGKRWLLILGALGR